MTRFEPDLELATLAFDLTYAVDGSDDEHHAGQRVRAGQRLAAVGRSGSALFPHLHFQLQTAADADGEGLPSTFERFRRRLGGRTVDVDRGPIDSGELVEGR